KSTGFSWTQDGVLLAPSGQRVAFSIMVAAGNAPRGSIATIIQEDLRALGMRVDIVPLEFRAMLDRVTNTLEYEAAVMGIASGDVDLNSDVNVWLSNGSTHLWHLHEDRLATPWQAEIDRLMREQVTSTQLKQRKQFFDRLQV